MLYICHVFASNGFHFSDISILTGQDTSPEEDVKTEGDEKEKKGDEEQKKGDQKTEGDEKQKKGTKRSASASKSKEQENERKDMRPDSKIKLLPPPVRISHSCLLQDEGEDYEGMLENCSFHLRRAGIYPGAQEMRLGLLFFSFLSAFLVFLVSI